MLWFAMATDGPTWYVGKREEFGQPRGWLQVKSDAASPAEIKGVWNIWFSSEKAWKECRSVKCVAVSATPGVYIVGPTPNSLLQDKLGEYRRVQLRVVKPKKLFLSLPKCRTPTFAICPEFESKSQARPAASRHRAWRLRDGGDAERDDVVRAGRDVEHWEA